MKHDFLCPGCGTRITKGCLSCPSCNLVLDQGPLVGDGSSALTWMIDIPLVNNRFIMKDVLKAFGLSGGIMFLIMAIIFIFQGEYDVIPMMALVSLCCTGFLIVIGLFAMTVMLRNRIRSRFTVDTKGVGYTMSDKLARFWTRAAIVGGGLRGNLTATGTGLIAASREQERYSWRDLKNFRSFPGPGVIELRNSWRVVVRLYCPEGSFDRVLKVVQNHLPPG